MKIYTDGACSGNPGPGGWAAIVIGDGEKRALRGGEDRTTNNRMELEAVIEGLRDTPSGADVTVHTDSSYIVNTMTRGWKRRANRDLWAQLDTEVASRRVRWQWVKGHSGHPLNEEADSLAYKESQARAGRRSSPPGTEPGLTHQDASGQASMVGGQGRYPDRRSAAAVGKPLSEAAGTPAYGQSQTRAGRRSAADTEPGLTHVDASGQASMVDVGDKAPTRRVAVAAGRVVVRPRTMDLIVEDSIEKGDVLGTARLAAIMAAKRTSELVPLCHVLPIESVAVEFDLKRAEPAVNILATVATTAKTGVEMEALTAASVAALTIYDMCKAVDRDMRIENIRLVSKTGGRTDISAADGRE